MTAPAALRTAPTEPAHHNHCAARGPGERLPEPPDAAGELVDGVTARWGLHERTEARARELGMDLVRWPLDSVAAGWEQDATCAGSATEEADQLSECLSQIAATELVSRLCSVCPVIRQCFETGRTTGGHGIWGGISLRDGRIAPWQTAAERVRRAKAAETTLPITTETTLPITTETTLLDGEMPAEILQVAEIPELVSTEPTERRRPGQRVQPRKFSRAARRSHRRGRAVR